MEEENLEYLKATRENDLVEIADASGICFTFLWYNYKSWSSK